MVDWYYGNSGVLAGFFLASLAVSLIVFRPLKGKRHPDWRVFDLGIILVGTLGLFGLSFQASLTAAQQELPFRKTWATYYRSQLSTLLEQADIVCTPHPVLPSYPPGSQEVEDDRHQVCDWLTSVFKTPAVLIIQGKDEVFNTGSWKTFPRLRTWFASAFPFQNDGKLFRDTALAWDQNVAAIKKATNPTSDNDFYLAVIFLGPFILAIAISAQITKILYEKRD